MGILSGNPMKEPMHSGEVTGVWAVSCSQSDGGIENASPYERESMADCATPSCGSTSQFERIDQRGLPMGVLFFVYTLCLIFFYSHIMRRLDKKTKLYSESIAKKQKRLYNHCTSIV